MLAFAGRAQRLRGRKVIAAPERRLCGQEPREKPSSKIQSPARAVFCYRGKAALAFSF